MPKKITRHPNNNHVRYALVFFLFSLVAFFGKNMAVPTPEQKLLLAQKDAQKSDDNGLYNLNIKDNDLELTKILAVKKGECGRLFFGLRTLPNNDDSTEVSTENPRVKLLLLSKFDQSQEIGTYEILRGKLSQNESAAFCVNADYSSVVFKRDSSNLDGPFQISNISFYPLAPEKHNLDNLANPIIGNSNFDDVVYESIADHKTATQDFTFTWKNQIIGQAFTAASDTISGVDLKMAFSGSGGDGDYFLELREISYQNDKLELGSDRIAYYSFNKHDVEKTQKPRNGVYYFPLPANLVIGKTYLIGVSNYEVDFNIMNTLKMYGVMNDGVEHGLSLSVAGQGMKRPGDLYLKVYGASFAQYSGERILTGAKILDNGNGIWLYQYEQKGLFSDYLDLEKTDRGTDRNGDVFYDNAQRGISARDIDNNSFVYKINTLYPFLNIKIEAAQPGGGFTNSLFYYSLDNVNWQEIPSDWERDGIVSKTEGKDDFHIQIPGNRTTKTIYLKVTYDKNDPKPKNERINLFGLKNLKINSELIF